MVFRKHWACQRVLPWFRSNNSLRKSCWMILRSYYESCSKRDSKPTIGRPNSNAAKNEKPSSNCKSRNSKQKSNIWNINSSAKNRRRKTARKHPHPPLAVENGRADNSRAIPPLNDDLTIICPRSKTSAICQKIKSNALSAACPSKAFPERRTPKRSKSKSAPTVASSAASDSDPPANVQKIPASSPRLRCPN